MPTPATEAYWAYFNRLRPVTEHLPIFFADGSSITEMKGTCAKCEQAISGDAFRGIWREPIKNIYICEGSSYCRTCNYFTPMKIRVTHDEHGFHCQNEKFRPFIEPVQDNIAEFKPFLKASEG